MGILDSGARTEYSTGAVRDIKDGKGRFDMVPLKVFKHLPFSNRHTGEMLDDIHRFMVTEDVSYLYRCIENFVIYFYPCPETAYLQLAMHFENGARKYDAWNWAKGIPLHSFLDSAIRHLMKYSRGDTDEDHDRAFIWNIVCLIYTKGEIDNKRLPQELNDLRYYKDIEDIEVLSYEDMKMKEYQEQAEDLETFKDILDKSSDIYEHCFG